MHYKNKYSDNNEIISIIFGEYFYSNIIQNIFRVFIIAMLNISHIIDMSNIQFTVGEIFDNLNHLGINMTLGLILNPEIILRKCRNS